MRHVASATAWTKGGNSLSADNHESQHGRVFRLIDTSALARKCFTALGAGSAGQPVIEQMARHGVGTHPDGRIQVVDGDRVSLRNLIGTGYRKAHIGAPKAQVCAEMLREIDDRVNAISCHRHLADHDIPTVIQMARRSHLLGLFADSFDLMLRIADQCHSLCPQVMVAFGHRADYAEVGFSIPNRTPPLSTTMGRRRRQAIEQPEALGCDTAYIADFVAALCLRLLLGNSKGADLLPCYSDAPLFVVGLRRSWIFERQPEDMLRSIICVGAHELSERQSP